MIVKNTLSLRFGKACLMYRLDAIDDIFVIFAL